MLLESSQLISIYIHNVQTLFVFANYGSAEGPPRVVKIQNLLSHPDDINHDDEFAVTHTDERPTSVKASGWHKMERYVIRMTYYIAFSHPDGMTSFEP